MERSLLSTQVVTLNLGFSVQIRSMWNQTIRTMRVDTKAGKNVLNKHRFTELQRIEIHPAQRLVYKSNEKSSSTIYHLRR